MNQLIQQILNGLATGSIYALIAVGYSLIYGMLELINFAHGHIFMVSTFVALSVLLYSRSFILALFVGLATGALASIVVERVAYRPVRHANRIAPTVSAVGAALVIENLGQLVWGPLPQPFPASLPAGTFQLGPFLLPHLQPIILASALLLALLLFILVQRTTWGRHMRAIRDDLNAAELMGVHVNRVVVYAYALSGALGAFAGVLFAAYYNVAYLGMGFVGTMNAFTAAVIGGIGNLRGAFIGGLLLGLFQALTVALISSGFVNAVTFGCLILILLIRPYGLFGSSTVRPRIT
jgi:branched-chain amino acid transport system permease protein